MTQTLHNLEKPIMGKCTERERPNAQRRSSVVNRRTNEDHSCLSGRVPAQQFGTSLEFLGKLEKW